jgi:SPP1 family predicted phage head-tail adaptor
MNPGDLDRLIELQTRTVSDTDYGHRQETWVTVATLWAKVQQGKVTEQTRNSDEIAIERIKFTIRYRSNLSNLWRIVYQGRIYKIIGAPQEVGRRHWHVINAEYVGEYISE